MSQEFTIPATQSPSPVLSLIEGRPATTSKEVAKFFGKRHTEVLRDLGQIIANCPEEFSQRNFASAEYSDEQGKPRPMFHLFRDGFTLLAMGYTGQKAMQFKLAYIEAFNRMETELREQATLALPPAEPAIENAETPKQLLVPFNGTTLCVVEHKGEPYVALALIGEGMGISWGSQVSKLGKNRAQWELEYIHIKLHTSRTILCLPLRLLQKYLNTIRADRVKQGLESGVKFYQEECVATLLGAWRTHKTGQKFLPAGGEMMTALYDLVAAWGQVSQLSPATMKEQIRVAFSAPDIEDLNAEQVPHVIDWVQARIDEATARNTKKFSRLMIDSVPSNPPREETAFTLPALNPENEIDEADALMREYDNTQMRQSKELHVRIMNLIHWRFVGMEWFDLASSVICCMLSASRYERSGGAGEVSLPVKFAQELDVLLSRARWQEIEASRRPAA